MIEVINVKHREFGDPVYTYIGRPSPLGNPYEIGRDGSREAVIEKYERHLEKALSAPGRIRDEFERLVGLAEGRTLRLGCWCSPQACHGDVVKRKIEERLGGQPTAG